MEYVNEENLFKRDETRKEVRDKRKFTDPISHISPVIFEKAGITSEYYSAVQKLVIQIYASRYIANG